jgi:hypothetical protein
VRTVIISNDPDLADKINDFTAGYGLDLVILTANPRWGSTRPDRFSQAVSKNLSGLRDDVKK